MPNSQETSSQLESDTARRRRSSAVQLRRISAARRRISRSLGTEPLRVAGSFSTTGTGAWEVIVSVPGKLACMMSTLRKGGSWTALRSPIARRIVAPFLQAACHNYAKACLRRSGGLSLASCESFKGRNAASLRRAGCSREIPGIECAQFDALKRTPIYFCAAFWNIDTIASAASGKLENLLGRRTTFPGSNMTTNRS